MIPALYPLDAHKVTDLAVLHRAIDAFTLATLITGEGGEILVSHIPLILDRSRGKLGVLVGHVDRNNPQAAVLDGASVLAVFHGPDCYISPTAYATSQLPTWNSINVHVRGRAAVTESLEQVRLSLVRMAERLEHGPERFTLADDDPRVPRLLPHIVGFDIPIDAIDGRFKLGQEKGEEDRRRTAQRLMDVSAPAVRGFLATILPDLPQ